MLAQDAQQPHPRATRAPQRPVGRPSGDVRQALLQAAQALATPERGATVRELAAQGCVGLAVAVHTVKHMRAAGVLRIARLRRVAYRNRPVAEYEPATLHDTTTD